MNIIYLLIYSLVIIACSSCSSIEERPSGYEKAFYKKIMASDSIKNCKKNGGIIQKGGIMQMPICVIPYPDAGKPCRNSSECTHSCLLMGTNVPTDTPVEGECQHNSSPFGCYAPVENGKAGAALCVD